MSASSFSTVALPRLAIFSAVTTRSLREPMVRDMVVTDAATVSTWTHDAFVSMSTMSAFSFMAAFVAFMNSIFMNCSLVLRRRSVRGAIAPF